MTKSAPGRPKPISIPSGERGPRLQAALRRLGRTERPPRPAPGRPTYPPAEGLS
jgi:hypothetical protein